MSERLFPARPVVGVGAVVVDRGRVLLVKRARPPLAGEWSLPGGAVEIGETLSAALQREVLEETGYVVRATKLLAVHDKAKHDHPPAFWYVYKLFVLCELEGGAPTASHETLEVGFFGPTALPPLSRERVTEAQIQRMFLHLAAPNLPTDFD